MKTVIRNSYTPKLGDYCETIVVDRETNNAYIFDCDGVFTPVPQPVDVEDILRQAAEYTDEQVAPLAEKLDTIEEGAQVNVIESVTQNGVPLHIIDKTVDVSVPTQTSDLINNGSDGTDIYVESATLNDYYTKDETDTQIGYETTAREIADAGLQEQIDAIVASSDVVDIVGTYAALQAYDTTKLHDNDIIKVLTDETRDDATTYYRWDADTSTWSYIGAEGPFYTKAESDAIFTPMTRTINSKALSSDITLTAADVGALPDSTVIPTVNDATLTIQKNGTTVQTFTANQSTNATANITVPTDTSDLTNGAGYITSAALPTKTSDLQNDGEDGTDSYAEMSDLPTKTSDLQNDGADGTSTYVEADELGAAAFSNDYTDLDNKPTIPTVNNATLTIQKNGTDVATFTANSSTNQTANITVPTDTSDLTNGAGFITTAALANYYTKSETYSQQEVNSLIGAITVPTKTSDLINDGSDGTSTYVEADDLATVATTGAYSDLIGAPGDFTGTDGVNAGVHGLVPAPTTSDVDKYLKSDGTWATVQGGSGQSITDYFIADVPSNYAVGSNMNIYTDEACTTLVTRADFFNSVKAGQVRLNRSVPGIWNAYYVYFSIDNDTDYSSAPSEPLYILVDSRTGTTWSLDWSNSSSQAPAVALQTVYQEQLTAGTNITISSGTISAPANVSAFTNDSGYLTSSSLSNYYTKTETYSQGEVNALINAIPTYSDFTGATSGTAGAHGLVPAPAAGDQNKVLKGDGTWGKAASSTIFYMNSSETGATRHLYKASDMTGAVTMQDIIDANEGGQVIVRISTSVDPSSYSDMYLQNAYVASGDYQMIFLDNQYYYSFDTTLTSDSIFQFAKSEVQRKLTAGTNITINGNTISATDTTYSNFVGATSSVAGSAGLVPAPTTSDPDKFLKGDGTWSTVSAGSSGLVLYADQSLHDPANITNICTDSGLTATADPADMIAIIDAGSSVVIKNSTDEAVVITSYDDHTGMTPNTISFTGQFLSNWKTNSPEFIKFIYSNVTDTWSAEGVELPTDFTGASAGTAGTNGLVPAPAAGDQDKLLKGDGTWGDIDDRLYRMLVPTGTQITSNKNLATTEFLKVGRYYCSANATVATLTNCPTSSAFMMEVFSPLSTTIDNEDTAPWCYRLRLLTTFTGEMWVQQVDSGSTAGSFSYKSWRRYDNPPRSFSDLTGTVSTSQIADDAVTTAKINWADLISQGTSAAITLPNGSDIIGWRVSWSGYTTASSSAGNIVPSNITGDINSVRNCGATGSAGSTYEHLTGNNVPVFRGANSNIAGNIGINMVIMKTSMDSSKRVTYTCDASLTNSSAGYSADLKGSWVLNNATSNCTLTVSKGTLSNMKWIVEAIRT